LVTLALVEPETGAMTSNTGFTSKRSFEGGARVRIRDLRRDGYNASLRHAYLAGSKCSCMTTIGVSDSGKLSVLGRVDAPSDTHCVAADDIESAWLCAPSRGQVRKVVRSLFGFTLNGVQAANHAQVTI
jgi:hypothetical protein